MLLIGECGSTKSDWCFVVGGIRKIISTTGLNPALSSDSEIHRILSTELIPKLEERKIEQLFFYGAGIREETADRMKNILSLILSPSHIEVETDMMAAARSLCGRDPGVVCILGTGSNSCFFDGEKITSQFFSPGYLFGDEGGGVFVGKNMINDFLRHRLPAELHSILVSQHSLTRDKVLESVYREPLPNRYLAGFVPFIREHIDHPYMHELVRNSFEAFFMEQLFAIPDIKEYPIHFTGSVAYIFNDILIESMAAHKLNPGKIAKSPMEGLIDFHSAS